MFVLVETAGPHVDVFVEKGDDFEACGLHVCLVLFWFSFRSSISYPIIAVKFPKSHAVPYLICCLKGNSSLNTSWR